MMRPELLRPAILLGLFSFQMLAGVATAKPDRAQDEGTAFTLTTDYVRKATEVLRITNGKMKADPALAKKMKSRASEEEAKDDQEGVATAKQMAQQLESEPVTRQALVSAGISARNFALTVVSLFNAQMGAMVRQSGDKSKIEGVNPANISWVQEHPADLQRFGEQMKENQRLMKQGTQRRSPSDEKAGGAQRNDERSDD